MGRVAKVDLDQLAALRRLRAAFGDVEVLSRTPEVLPVTHGVSPGHGA
jgi:hypothetical protein